MEITLEQLDKIKIHFIVARPRTGSTLLATMLNQHENILCIVEQPFAYFLSQKYLNIKNWDSSIIEKYCDDFYLFARKNLKFQFGKKEELVQSLEQYKESLNYSRAIRITYLCFFPLKDKTKISTIINKQLIMGNYLNKMSKLFPESNFIFLYRNPLDNVERRQEQKRQKKESNKNLYNLSIEWIYNYGMILYKKQKISLKRTFDIHYENLILYTELELKRICNQVHLPYSEQMLQYKDSNKSIKFIDKSISDKGDKYIDMLLKLHEGISKDPDKSKIGAWKENISQKDADLIWRICGDTAKKMGYEKEGSITEVPLPLIYYIHYFKFIIFKKYFTILWYSLPFSIKRGIKHVGNLFKSKK